MEQPLFVEAVKNGGYRILVLVQPGAKQNQAAGVQDGRLKVRLRAQAIENKANEALVLFLSELTGLPKSSLELSAGHSSRKKTIRVKAGFEPVWRDLE